MIATLSAVVLRRQLQSLNHNGAAHEGRHGRASQPPRSQSLSETTPVRSTHANSRQYWLEGNQDRLDHTPPALDDHPRSSCSSPESGGSYSSSGDSLPDNSDGSVVADIRFDVLLYVRSSSHLSLVQKLGRMIHWSIRCSAFLPLHQLRAASFTILVKVSRSG